MLFSDEPFVLLLAPALLFLGMVSIVCFRVLMVFTREVVAAGPFQRDVFLVRKLPFLPEAGEVGMFTRVTEYVGEKYTFFVFLGAFPMKMEKRMR
jgi:hypothetical protein